MSWNGKDGSEVGVIERGFETTYDGRRIPGVYWSPEGGPGDRLVLLGHGGTTHKKAEYIEQIAHALCKRGGAAMAIDGPGHGDRATSETAATDSHTIEAFDELWNGNGGTESIVADWTAALDFIESEDGARPTGWWGLSMGTMMGLPLAVAQDRVRVAVLGLMGNWGPNGDDVMRVAPDLLCPVRFLMQWDDELVPREAALELFGALGTNKKTMHANPGGHAEVPFFEVAASLEYLDRYLV